MTRNVTRCLAVLLAVLGLSAAGMPGAAAGPVPHVLTSGAVGAARQVVLVRAASATTTYGSLELWQRGSDGAWRLVRGRAAVRLGRAGLSADKREGDGKTPVGVFPFGMAFGWYGNPGTRLPYRPADDASRWVDDSASRYYNLWMYAPANGRWTSAEKLRISPYLHAVQIGYNLARTPGRGSAIFLHLTTGGATAGCVATDKGTVLAVMRWADPRLTPRFVIGTDAWIASH